MKTRDSTNQFVKEILDTNIKIFQQSKKAVLFWILSDMEIPGNEEADIEARYTDTSVNDLKSF